MKNMGKILFFFGLFVFISGQSAYAQGLGGITSGISKSLGGISNGLNKGAGDFKSGVSHTLSSGYQGIKSSYNVGKDLGSKTLDGIGNAINIKSIKTTTGDFVSKYTNPSVGGKVQSSRWRDVATFSGFRKAVGIVAGTAQGVLGGSKDSATVTALKVGGLKGSDLAQGAFHNNPERQTMTLRDNVLDRKDQSSTFYYKDKGLIKTVPVYTDNTGKQLTQEFMSNKLRTLNK